MEELIRDFFRDHGYIALLVLMVLDNIGVPLPSEIPLFLAGIAVSAGDMDYIAAVAVAAAGSLAGAIVAYWLGMTIGRAVAVRWGRLVLLTPQDLDRAHRWFERRGELAVLLCRMIPLARTLVSIPAGVARMDLRRFSLYTLIGSTLWCLAMIGAGWSLGRNAERLYGGLSFTGVILASMVAMVAVGWYVKRRARIRERGGTGDPAEEPRDGAGEES